MPTLACFLIGARNSGQRIQLRAWRLDQASRYECAHDDVPACILGKDIESWRVRAFRGFLVLQQSTLLVLTSSSMHNVQKILAYYIIPCAWSLRAAAWVPGNWSTFHCLLAYAVLWIHSLPQLVFPCSARRHLQNDPTFSFIWPCIRRRPLLDCRKVASSSTKNSPSPHDMSQPFVRPSSKFSVIYLLATIEALCCKLRRYIKGKHIYYEHSVFVTQY